MVAMLDDEDLQRSVGHGWTVSAALAHLAYWDGKRLEDLKRWKRDGVGSVQVVPLDPDRINDSMLPTWLAMPPRQAANEAIAAAEAADRCVEELPAELAEAILAQQPRALYRAAHRREHLDEIERAIGKSTT